MPEQFGDKQHEATPYRRQKAREEGHVARSNDLVSAIMLLASVVALMYIGRQIAVFLGAYTIEQFTETNFFHADVHLAKDAWSTIVFGLARSMLPIFLVLLVVAIIANVGQTGFLFLPQKVTFKPEHLSPIKGLGRLFSMNSAMRLVLGIFKILVVATVALGTLSLRYDEILGATNLEVGPLAVFLADVVFWTILYVALALLILALIDYAFQRWKFEQDIRMTTQEVREEFKTLQGDPQILARRKQVQRQLTLNRLEQTVPEADVIATNPTELAVAIKYDFETMPAPVVVAKGAGMVAQRIRRMGLENDIPIVERKELARFLYKHVEVNQPVPIEQYAAVAELLKYVYELKGKPLPTAAA